jgi:hypothetical protein
VTATDREAQLSGLLTDPTPDETMLKIELAAVAAAGVNEATAEPPATAVPDTAPLPDAA